MTHIVRLCLALHNHQPIGNFDGVFEQAYRDSYQPFLDVFEPYHDLRISLHTSGPLLEWLDRHHPDYLDRVARLVREGRIEIVGGAFYEPILTMIPPRDRVGQITDFTAWLEERLGATVQGMWIPERVWEQSLTADIATAGISYTILDDFHFKNAGLSEDELFGFYLTEDAGHLLNVFPGSERLRYLIPFAAPEDSLAYLHQIGETRPNAVVVLGDDGEKFGTWPDTRKHVYEEGWLRRFFDMLTANRDWLKTTTLAEAADQVLPLGKVYLPDSSYREMTEWALPVARQTEYETLVHDFAPDGRWGRLQRFLRGGFWRNFKVKYPETNEMYTRMLGISRQLDETVRSGVVGDEVWWARRALYRGQCNCGYWHGAFGGAYLPHLRNAVYNQLIAAENLLDQAVGRTGPRIDATVDDYNLDGRQEVRLVTDKLIGYVAPSTGGQLYELDVRSICHNLLATLARRPEVYHRKVRAGASDHGQNVASIHERVVFKQAGLDMRLQYDAHPRKSLMDHFYDAETSLETLQRGEAPERGDFVAGVFEARVRRNPDRIQVQLVREGTAFGLPIKITKGITARAGSSQLEIGYLLEGVPQDRPMLFGVEFNFAGLPAGADDRYYYRGDDDRLGRLESRLQLRDVPDLSFVDHWLGIHLRLAAGRATNFWTFPVETVSQSEGGFELVHQSIVVHPYWFVQGDAAGRWSVTLTLDIDTQLAESRQFQSAERSATV